MKNKSLFAVILFLVYGIAFAAASPVTMLSQTSDQMLTALKQSSNRSDATLYQIVETILLPHIALDNMASEVVGSTYWNQATPAQRAEFQKQFTHYVTQTYSGALSAYQDQTVKFFPIRGGFAGKNLVQVNSEVDQKNGQSIPVSYKVLSVNGEWKVADFSVDGVSMVQSYRAQFADILRQQGFAGLLQQLQLRNKS